MMAATAQTLIDICLANFPLLNKNVMQSKTLILWLEKFGNIDDELMKEAIDKTLDVVRDRFPTVGDIKATLKEIQHSRRQEPSGLLDRKYEWKADIANDGHIARIYFNAGKQEEFIQHTDYYQQLLAWARQFFPDIDMVTVQQNESAISLNMEANKRCLNCQREDGRCPSNGYCASMTLENGKIDNNMRHCKKKAKAEKGA